MNAEQRVAALIAAAANRRAAANARRARQQLARRHGLAARHTTKLRRLEAQATEPENNAPAPDGDTA